MSCPTCPNTPPLEERCMCSRYPISLIAAMVISLAGCNGKPRAVVLSAEHAESRGVIQSALDPGVDHSLVTTDPRAAAYYNNAEAVNTGKRLFQQYNCSGCHSNGGGGMAPDLMDDVW